MKFINIVIQEGNIMKNNIYRRSFKERLLRTCTLWGILLGVLLFVCIIDVPAAQNIGSRVKTVLNIKQDDTILEGIMEKFSRSGQALTWSESETPGAAESVAAPAPDDGEFRIDENILEEIDNRVDMYLRQ